ncbi:MAG: hypothetical protein K0Q81_1153, partial [Paenibacillus sp.]|nr:hypothetical protein [Paenibacillus sp.]
MYILKHHRHRHRSYSYLLLFILFSLVVSPLWSTPAQAGKEGVYLSNNVYFTLSDVLLSSGSDSQNLRFALNLVNDSDNAVDYNAFGARVTDSSGSSYSVQLSEKTSARVQPHKAQAFKYSSTITSGLNVSDLRVVLFAWDSSEADYMRDLGSLSVGEAASDQTTSKQSLILNIGEVDATLPVDAVVSIEPVSSTKVVKDGVWTMYVNLRIENLGSSGFKLPSGITFQLVDARGLSFTATAAAGNDILLPKQASKLTLQANVGGSFTDNQFSVQFLNKTQTATTLLGSLAILNSDSFQVGQVHDLPSLYPNGVTVSVDRASFKSVADGVTVEATVDLINNGKSIITLPAISAAYQGNTSGLSVASSESVSQSYLSPKESITQTFRATLPIGADMKDTSLILFEKKSGTPAVLLPIINISMAGSDPSGSGVITPTDGTTVNTSAGALAIEWKQTQRLTLESDDVLLSEFTVRNVTGSIVTLPPLYGGFSIGDFEVTGKAVRLQSSAYINPNDTTTVYLYSKIPYTLDASKGTIFIGEGTTQSSGGGSGAASGAGTNTNAAATVTPAQEWLRASFTIQDDGITTIGKASEWTISDQGRGSVASVIDSQVFTLASTNQKMLAVRLIQTGKEKRIGNIVPYSGYFVGPDGSIWNAKVTEESGRFCNGCVALTTLWVPLPEVVSSSLTEYDLVFGQKLDETALTSVHRFSMTNLGSQLPIPVAKAVTASDT